MNGYALSKKSVDNLKEKTNNVNGKSQIKILLKFHWQMNPNMMMLQRKNKKTGVNIKRLMNTGINGKFVNGFKIIL